MEFKLNESSWCKGNILGGDDRVTWDGAGPELPAGECGCNVLAFTDVVQVDPGPFVAVRGGA